MTTLRKLPTAKPNKTVKHNKRVGSENRLNGKTSGAQAHRYTLVAPNPGECAAVRGVFLDNRSKLEDRQIHRDNHAANQCTQNDHDHGFHQARQRLHGIVDFRFKKVRDL